MPSTPRLPSSRASSSGMRASSNQLADVRHDLVLHELADRVADQALLVVEQPVDGQVVAWTQVGAGG